MVREHVSLLASASRVVVLDVFRTERLCRAQLSTENVTNGLTVGVADRRDHRHERKESAMMGALRRRNRVVTAGEVADREWAARLPELEDKLDAATTALRKASVDQLPSDTLRARYRAVTDASDAAIAAAEAGYRLAVGPIDGMPNTRVIAARGRPAAVTWRHLTQQLRLARQQHLLSASPVWGGVPPDCEHAEALSALGPFWPGTDFLPAEVAYRRRVLPEVKARGRNVDRGA